MGQFQKKGIVVLFNKGVCSIYHSPNGKIVESIMSTNRTFVLLADSPTVGSYGARTEEKCLKITNVDQTKLWHHRYGHLSYKGLRTLHRNVTSYM